jgi:prepilin-type processing-associated H-X9-DG protein
MRRSSIGRLMIVIGLVALILGGCMGTVRMVRSFRETYSRPDCQSKVRNVVLAVLGYTNSKGAFPTGVWPNPSLPPEKRLSWYGAIVPYFEEKVPWYPLEKSQPWDSPENERIAARRTWGLRCPDAAPAPRSGPAPTHYIGIAGLGTDSAFLPNGHPRAGVFGYERRTTLADITDGASSTMIVAESARVRGSWLAGGPATVRGLDSAELPYIGPGRQFGGIHSSGTNIGFADGSVRFVSDTINPRILEAISTIAGGETVTPNDFP